MNTFISGGCKNGKSMYAQIIAKDLSEKEGKPLYYIATMIPTDDEDRARIKRHLSDREGWGFETVEIGTSILEIVNRDIDCSGVFLLDSVTALLSNEMFKNGRCDFTAGSRLASELTALIDKLGSIVFVSDYIYSDGRIFDSYTESYREALAQVDRTLAVHCDRVVEVAYGHKYFYK